MVAIFLGLKGVYSNTGDKRHWDILQTTFFKCILFNKNVEISIQISLKFIPEVSMDNIQYSFSASMS